MRFRTYVEQFLTLILDLRATVNNASFWSFLRELFVSCPLF